MVVLPDPEATLRAPASAENERYVVCHACHNIFEAADDVRLPPCPLCDGTLTRPPRQT